MKCSVRLGHGHAIHITQSCREYSAPGLRDGRRSSRKHAVNRVSVVDRNRGICWVSLVASAMCWAVQRGDRKNKRGLLAADEVAGEHSGDKSAAFARPSFRMELEGSPRSMPRRRFGCRLGTKTRLAGCTIGVPCAGWRGGMLGPARAPRQQRRRSQSYPRRGASP